MAQVAAVAAAMFFVACATGAPSGAAATATVTPNPIPVTPGQTLANVTLQYNFGSANTAVFFDVCKKQSLDPTFSYAQDCDRGAPNGANGSPNGAGTAAFDVPIGPTLGWQIFAQDIDKWGCFPAGAEVPAGFLAATHCYVRVTQGTVQNNTDAVDVPITFSEGGAQIPEAPVVVLPVLLAATALGGYFFFSRRSAPSA